MNKSVMIGVGIASVGVVIAMGRGPLNPPAGSVAPTGRTLQEIYDRIDGVAGGLGCNCGPWQSKVTGEFSVLTPLISGSGVLHAVIVPEARYLALYDNSGVQIADLRSLPPAGPSSVFALNIRYENGIQYQTAPGTAGSSNGCTLLYRPDPS